MMKVAAALPIQHQIFPPDNAKGSTVTTVVNGRTYSAAPGSVATINQSDASALEANGWTVVASGGAGTTSQRPVAPTRGTLYPDTTLGYVVVFTGILWRNPATGAAV